MNRFIYKILTMIIFSLIFVNLLSAQKPVISGLYYDEILTSGVTLHWQTDTPAGSTLLYMVSDSNGQPVRFTDSVVVTDLLTDHNIQVNNLLTATMYRYLVISCNTSGCDTSSGYFITQSLSSGKVSVWFNHTVDTSVSAGIHAKGSYDFLKLITEQIDKAEHSIDLTTWAFELDSVADCLIRAKNRGVKIRFVYNYTEDTPQIEHLKENGIQVVKRNFDTTYTMHNKFWVFDHRYNSNPQNQYLWTGSTNMTHAQFHSDRNNIILIQDQSLCEVYTREFEEMWGSHTDLPDIPRSKFGTEKSDNVAHILNVGGVKMEVYFAPTDSISRRLVNLFTTIPVKSICFSMLKFVMPEVEEALHSSFLKGITIAGVFDSSNAINSGSAFPRMKGENVAGTWQPAADVFIDPLPGLIHHKYSVINADTSAGEKVVTTGSFNWEIPAQQGNDENMMVIHDATINNLYFQEFVARYRESGGSQVGGTWGIGKEGSYLVPFSVRCFPNPFSDQTTLKFILKQVEPVTLEFYDPTGNLVLKEIHEITCTGTHQINLNGKALPIGLLLCRVKTASASASIRLIHLTH